MAVDIVDDFLTRLQQLAPDAAARFGPQLEAGLRQDWGGIDRHYIRKGIGTSRKTERLALALREGKPMQQAIAEAFVKRSRGFEMLAKPFKVKG